MTMHGTLGSWVVAALLVGSAFGAEARQQASWSGSLLSQYLRGEGGSPSQRQGMADRPVRAAERRSVAESLRRSDALRRRGAAAESLQLLDETIRTYPADPSLQVARAVVLERLGRDDKAQSAYRTALSLDADHVVALTGLGVLMAERGGDPAGAEKVLRRALDLQPANAPAIDGLGWLAYKQGAADQAERLFERARAVDATAPGPLYHLGLTALRRKDLAKALSSFQQVVQHDPSHDRAFISLGMLYERLGERQKAMEALGAALALVGTKGPIADRVAGSLRRLDPHWRPPDSLMGRASAAHPGLPPSLVPPEERPRPRSRPSVQPTAPVGKRPVQPSVPSTRPVPAPKPRSRLALLPERSVQPTAAPGGAADLRTAVAASRSLVHRSLVDDHMRLGRLYYEFGLMRDAAGEFQTVINLAPLSAEARDAKDLVEALDDFVDPTLEERLQGYLSVGAALFKRNDLENAKLQYKKMLLLEPTHAVAHKNLAYIYLKEGLQNEAWTHVVEALRLRPGNPEALVLQGYVQARRRNFRDAEAAFQGAARAVAVSSPLGRYARDMAEKMALYTDLR